MSVPARKAHPRAPARGRSAAIVVCVTPQTKAKARANAQQQGVSLSHFVERLIEGGFAGDQAGAP